MDSRNHQRGYRAEAQMDFLEQDPYANPAPRRNEPRRQQSRSNLHSDRYVDEDPYPNPDTRRSTPRRQPSRAELYSRPASRDPPPASPRETLRGTPSVPELSSSGNMRHHASRVGMRRTDDLGHDEPARQPRPQASRPELRARDSRNRLDDEHDIRAAEERARRKRKRTHAHYDPQSDDDEEDEEDYGKVSKHWSMAHGVAEEPVVGFEPDALQSMHARFHEPARVRALLPPGQIDTSIAAVVDQLTKYAKILPVSDSFAELDAYNIIPSIKYPTGHLTRWVDVEEHTARRPNSLVFCANFLRDDRLERYESWVEQVGVYGVSGDDPNRASRDRFLSQWARIAHRQEASKLDWKIQSQLPDIFSTSHYSCAISNGRRQIVTLYKPTPYQAETQVFVSPSPAIDMEFLGSAAIEFRDRFNYLLEPFRVPDLNHDWFTVVPEREKPADMTPKESTWEKWASQGVDLVDFSSLKVMKSRSDGNRLTEDQVTQTISKLARSHSPNVPLTPGIHRAFGYNASVHTYERGYTGIWDQDLEDEAPRPEQAIDVGKDLEFVTALTGAIGLTFVFDIDPKTLRVKCFVHTSFHFWDMHQKDIFNMVSLIYNAIKPGFTIIELARRGLEASGFKLPFQPSEIAPIPPLELPLRYQHCQLARVLPETLYKMFPDPRARQEVKSSMDNYAKLVAHYRDQSAKMKGVSKNATYGNLASGADASSCITKQAQNSKTLTAVPETPTPMAKTGLRPLLLSTDPTSSVVGSPTPTAVDTPRYVARTFNRGDDPFTNGRPPSLFQPGDMYEEVGEKWRQRRATSYKGP